MRTMRNGEALTEDAEEDQKKGESRWPSATVLVGIAVVIGIAVGFGFSNAGWGKADVTKLLALPGQLWLKSLKCIVLPMIIFSMVEAMVMMRTLPGAKTVGIMVVALYTFTTVMAATEGCIFAATLLTPNIHKMNMTAGVETGKAPEIAELSSFDTILGIFDNLVPDNLVNEAAHNNLLPIILASIIFGILAPERNEDGGKSYSLALVRELNGVVMKVVTKIMSATPIGVCSLVFASAAQLDLATMGASVAVYILTVVAALLFHMLVVYPGLLMLFARRNPCTYYANLLPAFGTALGTSSSAATLPVTTECSVNKNCVRPHLAKFVLSLGATINMDGTSIYLIIACYFLGLLQGVNFSFADFITMGLLATFCSMGTAPVPSASLVLLATIMTAVGVPFNETFGIISAVDWMLDRLRTVVNVAGDSCVVGIVNARAADDTEHDDASAGYSSGDLE